MYNITIHYTVYHYKMCDHILHITYYILYIHIIGIYLVLLTHHI